MASEPVPVPLEARSATLLRADAAFVFSLSIVRSQPAVVE
jgi:hypothetical protein